MSKTNINDVFRDTPKRANQTLRLTLPIPPSVNKLYYNTRGGKTLTANAKRFSRDAKALLNLYIEEQKWIMPSKQTWLYMDMVFYFPDRRRRDAHNCLKLLLDVLTGYVYEDDYTALPRIQSVEYDKHNPRVEIKVYAQTQNERNRGLKMTQHVL